MSSGQKVILISGGSRGLGQALVADFLAAGHIVATFSRKATPFIDECQEQYADAQADRFFWQAVDATEVEQLKEFAFSVIRRYGRVDVLINNAAIGVEGILTLMPESAIERGIALNLEAVIYLTRTCLKSMLQQQDGCIINISSIVGIRGYNGMSVYSATKAALDGFSRSLAREMGKAGIRVNSIAPGYFESDMSSGLAESQRARIIRRTPLRRLGTMQDFVGVVRFLISPEASFITGQTIVVDGGITC
jgi:3-oxoacyl-[acyl-carrier protein] reductase